MGIRTQVTRVKEQGCYHWAIVAIVDEHGLRDKLKQKRAELGQWRRLVDELGDDGDRTNQDGRDGGGVRLDAGKVMEAVRRPGERRRAIGNELLRWWREVNMGRTTEKELEGDKESRRCAWLPGTCW
jgi:hypothetical protein